jgi:hypothetical protein
MHTYLKCNVLDAPCRITTNCVSVSFFHVSFIGLSHIIDVPVYSNGCHTLLERGVFLQVEWMHLPLYVTISNHNDDIRFR